MLLQHCHDVYKIILYNLAWMFLSLSNNQIHILSHFILIKQHVWDSLIDRIIFSLWTNKVTLQYFYL